MDANTGISRVAIVGTGLIGGSWAACFLAHGLALRTMMLEYLK
jgi:3-hydroxyacyl-CoA dehydrogenase